MLFMCAVSCSLLSILSISTELSSLSLPPHRWSMLCSRLETVTNLASFHLHTQNSKKMATTIWKDSIPWRQHFSFFVNRKFNNDTEWTDLWFLLRRIFSYMRRRRKSFLRKAIKEQECLMMFYAERNDFVMPTNENLVNGFKVVKFTLQVLHSKLWFYCHRCRQSWNCWNLFQTCQTYFHNLLLCTSCHRVINIRWRHHFSHIASFKYMSTYFAYTKVDDGMR